MLHANEWYVIKKDGRYLVGCPYDDSCFLRWSDSPYDGYKSKNFDRTRRMAYLLGGKVKRFNQLNGKTEGGWR